MGILNVQTLKKLIPYIITIICTILITGAISQGYNNKQLDKVSRELNDARVANSELRETNSRLTESNTRLTSTVGELEEQINRDNREHQERIDEIKRGLENIAANFGTAKDTIRTIIEGIEQIKKLIADL